MPASDTPSPTVLLAHGAGAGMDHPWMLALDGRLAGHGLHVVRFEFPYMQARRRGIRRGPDRMPVLLDAFRDAAAACGPVPLTLAGKSMGGRVATMLADELGAIAAVAFGYPFHPPGKPDRLRTEHLEALRTPTLVLQGERDPFGLPEEVAAYRLSPRLRVQWLPDGEHSFRPRKRSGISLEDNLETAAAAAARFVLSAASRAARRRT